MGCRAHRASTDGGRARAVLLGALVSAVLFSGLWAPIARGADLAPCIPDGRVDAITHAEGNTYIGGAFSAVGQRSGPGVPLVQFSGASGGGSSPPCTAGTDPESTGEAPASGQPVHPFPEVSGGQVLAAIADGSGGWYIGGTFTSVGGEPRDRLAHIASDGTVASGVGDPTTANGGNGIDCSVTQDCAVDALALDPTQGVLYVGGSFDGVGLDSTQSVVTPSPNLAAINTADGTPVTDPSRWNPPSPDGPVDALASFPITVDVSTDGGTTVTPTVMSILVVGGSFDSLGPSSPGVTLPGQLGAVWGVGATQSCVPGAAGSPCTASTPGTATAMGGDLVLNGPGASPGSSAAPWKPTTAFTDVSTVAVGEPIEKDDTNPSCGTFTATGSGAGTTNEAGTCTEYLPIYVGGTASSGAPLQAFQLPIIARVAPTKYATELPGLLGSYSTYSSWDITKTFAPTTTGSDGNEYVDAVALSPSPTRAEFVTPAAAAAAPAPPTVYFGGDFTEQPPPPQAGQTAIPAWTNLAAVSGIGDPSSSSQQAVLAGWAPGDTGIDGPVDALAVYSQQSPDIVYVGGDFTQPSCGTSTSVTCDYAAAFYGANGSNSNAIADWTPSLAGGPVYALAIDPQASNSAPVYAGGAFESTGAVPRSGLAALDSSGSLLSWNPGATISSSPAACLHGATSPQVDALASSGSTVYVGGVFDTLGGATHCNLGAVDASTGAPVSGFSADADAAVLALASTGSALYAGGKFSQIGGQSRAALAKLDASTGAVDAQWDPAASWNGGSPEVDSIAAGCQEVYVGGDFSTVGGLARGDLAALDPTTGTPTSWNPDAESYVDAILPAGNLVYVAGHFSTVGSGGGHYVAALDPSSGTASSSFYSAAGYTVHALALAGTTLYEGQEFGGPGGNGGVQNLIAAQGDSSSSSWGEPLVGLDTPAPGGDVLALSAYGSELYIGGDFIDLGTSPQEGFAAIPLATDVGTGAITCAPAAQLSVGSLLFGSQTVGTISQSKTVTLTNDGNAPLMVSGTGVALAGSGASQYLVTSDGCSGKTIAVGSSCAVSVAFAPKSAGSTLTASLELTDNAPDSPQAVSLSGAGLAVVAPPSLPPAPAITIFKQSHVRWTESGTANGRARHRTRLSAPVGTVFTLRLSQAARLTFVFTAKRPGRGVGGRCLAPSRANRRRAPCTRIVTFGTLTAAGQAGQNHVPFNGRIGDGRVLAPGTYTVYAIATGSSGQNSTPQALTFTIAAPSAQSAHRRPAKHSRGR